MKLINLQTLTLEDHNETDAPSYAILSPHTRDKEEVTFADWNTETHGAHLAGFSKIKGFISRAREMYDSSHGWVDTCCIDKSSSAELTEAINSMFRYYSNATVCIVHLADVADDLDVNTSRDVETAICQARWLSRGWTLQELIAPRHVEFFGRSWGHLGTLDGMLLYRLAKVTGIPRRVLASPYNPSAWSIAQRMSWASKRCTTRIEDEAYSLLGIFDVSLPLIYGEGCRAFMRLQEEIIQRSADYSIFAWDRHISNDYEHGRCQLVFAESPADFCYDNITQCYQESHGWVEPFEMTNLGLRLSIPLKQCGDSQLYHGILNCRFYDYEKGPIALNLWDLDPLSTEANVPLTLVVMPLQLDWPNQTPENGPICTARHMNRISVLDEEDLISKQKRHVLVLRESPLSPLNANMLADSTDTEFAMTEFQSRGERQRIKIIVNDEHDRETQRRWVLPERDWDERSNIWFSREDMGAITFANASAFDGVGSASDEADFTIIFFKASMFRDEIYEVAIIQNMEQHACADLLHRREMMSPYLHRWRCYQPIRFRGGYLDIKVELERHAIVSKGFYLGVVTVRDSNPYPKEFREYWESIKPSKPPEYRPMPELRDPNTCGLIGKVCVAEPWKAEFDEDTFRPGKIIDPQALP